MKQIAVIGSTSGTRKMLFLSMAAALVQTAVVVAGGRCDWSMQADTTKPAQDETSQHGFWAHVKDLRLGPLTFALSGQWRLRYESYDDLTLKGFEPGGYDQLLLERFRLELTARFWDKPRVFLQLQDSHPFLTKFNDSDFPKSSPIENTLDVRQLYVEWLRIGESPFGFRLGRQQISYGDQRVFGPGNWGNTGRFAWDAAVFKIEVDQFWMDLWVGKFLQYKTTIWPDRPVTDFLTFVTYTGIKNLPFGLDLFYVNTCDNRAVITSETGTGNIRSHSLGIQTAWQGRNDMDGGATLVAQFGRYGGDRLHAFGANAKWGVTIRAPWKPRLGVQFTHGSGDRNPADGVHETFDGVFGGRDIQFYGYLNLFFWANLRDYEVDCSVLPHPNMTVHLEYHHFTLDRERDAWYTTGLAPYRRDRTGQSGLSLGDELDVRATWNLQDHLELMGGYGSFFPGFFVSHTGLMATAHWYFVQAAYTW